MCLIDQNRKTNEAKDESALLFLRVDTKDNQTDDTLAEQIGQVGAKIKVQWSESEVGDSGWKPGWYTGTVQKYYSETQTITVVYQLEPNNTYEEEIIPLISQKRVKLLWSPI